MAATVRSVMVQVEGIKWTRGRSKLTWVEIVRKDLSAYDLVEDVALDRVHGGTSFIYPTPSSWNKV